MHDMRTFELGDVEILGLINEETVGGLSAAIGQLFGAKALTFAARAWRHRWLGGGGLMEWCASRR